MSQAQQRPENSEASYTCRMESAVCKTGLWPTLIHLYPHEIARMPHEIARMPHEIARMPSEIARMPHEIARMPRRMAPGIKTNLFILYILTIFTSSSILFLTLFYLLFICAHVSVERYFVYRCTFINVRACAKITFYAMIFFKNLLIILTILLGFTIFAVSLILISYIMNNPNYLNHSNVSPRNKLPCEIFPFFCSVSCPYFSVMFNYCFTYD